MKSRIIAAVLLVIIAAGAFLRIVSRRTTQQPVEGATNVVSQPQPSQLENNHTTPVPPIESSVTNAVAAGTEADHAKLVQKRIDELGDLAMKDDVASRDVILSELQNPDKAIRAGALEAIVQFGDRSVVPRLEQLAAQTADAEEKAALLEAAEYLKLPSLSEFLAAQKGKTNAIGTNSVRDPNKRR